MDIQLTLMNEFCSIRQQTEKICQPLQTEDYIIQSIPDVSPPKWHLAHTTWFFETFVLHPTVREYAWYNPIFQFIFNSYYKSLSHENFQRDQRGTLARPTVNEVYHYRSAIDEAVIQLLQKQRLNATLLERIRLGLHHEQQHQELMLMDIKHNFFADPSQPLYHQKEMPSSVTSPACEFISFSGGLKTIGHSRADFCYDNELPPHEHYLHPFALMNRLVTNKEYLEFIDADSYNNPLLWLDDGWNCIKQQHWQMPLYWQKVNGEYCIHGLHGLHPLILNEPVSHLSYYEADAYARWRGYRLPTEFEWETAASTLSITHSNFADDQFYHPQAASQFNGLQQMFGDVWEWTASPYLPYPGYRSLEGALGEYNAKFMNNQMVLRGGSCLTPRSHIRPTYRNFFPQDKRWACTGLRLAKNL